MPANRRCNGKPGQWSDNSIVMLSCEDVERSLKSARTLEESERRLNAFREKLTLATKTEEMLDMLLWGQFHATPYHEMYARGVEAFHQGEIRSAADLGWKAFQQATEWGQLSPGRIFLLMFSFQVFKDQVHLLKKKDKRRLDDLLYDKRELVVIRMIAAYFMGYLPISLMRLEEKMDHYRKALLLEPTTQELEHRTVCPRNDESVRSVSDLLQEMKERLEINVQGRRELLTLQQKTVFSKEICPPEVDHDLFLRTSTFGGRECDYCNITIEELGVRRLLVCTGCRNASYCGRACQRQAYKEGHKEECRPDGCCVQGDIMHVTGLHDKPDLNGRLVCVLENNEPFTEVRLLRDASSFFVVQSKSLKHIRPASTRFKQKARNPIDAGNRYHDSNTSRPGTQPALTHDQKVSETHQPANMVQNAESRSPQETERQHVGAVPVPKSSEHGVRSLFQFVQERHRLILGLIAILVCIGLEFYANRNIFVLVLTSILAYIGLELTVR